MKRSLVVLSAALALVSAGTLAQQRGPMFGQGRGPMSGPGRGQMAGLQLTEEQHTKMSDLRVAFLKETEPLRAELEQQQRAMRLEITADKWNESRVKSLQAEIGKLQSDLAWKQINHQRAVRGLLTAEQQKRFDERLLTAGPGPGRGQGMRRGMMPGGHGRGNRMCDDCPKTPAPKE